MVASIRSLANVDHTVHYMYYSEKELETRRGWHKSKGIEALGFKAFKKEDFENILSGKITKDAELGQRTSEGIKHHPGHDLTFSAPKSVSIMGLVAGDERVLECHERAVAKALDYVQRRLIYTRVQQDGNLSYEQSDNALIAKFTHITSRPSKSSQNLKPDPQLHTHCLIANATLCKDGVWRSVVFDSLYDNKMLLGEIYRMELIRELASIGYEVEITRTSKGRFMFEIKGVPQEDIDTLSTRRKDILREAEKRGVSDAVDMAKVALDTRASKITYSRDELQREWEARVKSLAILLDLKNANTNKSKLKGKISQDLLDTALQYGVIHLSSREAVFSETSLQSAIIERLAEHFGTKDIEISTVEETIKAAIESKKILARHFDQNNMITTYKNLKAEKDTIALMQSMLGAVKPILLKKEAGKYFRNNKLDLSFGQKQAAMLALTTKDRVIGIQGSAGTGKTTVLETIKAIAEDKGVSLLGLAPTKAAVNVLKEHVPSHTVSYFVKRYEGVIIKRANKKQSSNKHNESITIKKLKESFSNKLIVLDEASLASTFQVQNLLKLADILRFRLLIVGDHRQLGGVPQGKPFYYLQDNGMNTCVMNEIKRQQNEELLKNVYLAESAVDKKEREAAHLINKILESLGKNVIDASKHKNTDTDNQEQNLVNLAYSTWLSLKDKDPLVIVPSHTLRENINARIRPHFVGTDSKDTKIGTLTRKDLTEAQMRYASRYSKGDILRFGKELKHLRINKGSYFYIKDIDAKENTLIIQQGAANPEAQEIKYNLNYKSAVNNLEVYETKTMNIAKGDRIRWTRNSQEHDFIVNGNSFVVKEVHDKTIEIECDKYGIKSIPLLDPNMQHIDYDYTSTVYGVQGDAEQEVLAILDSRLHQSLISQRAFYVSLSRAREKVTIVTDNAKNLKIKLSKSHGAKTSAIEHQEAIDNALVTIDINKAKREYMSPETHQYQNQNDEQTKNTPKYKYITKSRFLKDRDLIRDSAISLFGTPKTTATEEQEKTLTFETDFKFKSDKHDYWRDNIIKVDLTNGSYYRLNNIEDEDDYSGSLYDLAYEEGLFETEEQSKKMARIQKLLQESQAIQGTLADNYLISKRKIDTTQIKLSEDVRFIKRAYSSESKSYHPALLVIGRDKNTNEIKSAQITYLDPKTQDKNKSLETKKRSFGSLKNSVVELTTNKDAKDIFIAEGVETALSIAQVVPNARVIATLGSSNLKHIDVGTDKKRDAESRNKTTNKTLNKGIKNIIICADNDGVGDKSEPTPSRIAVEEAARRLIKQGHNVTVIMPELADNQKKADFNDVLQILGQEKLREYVEPIISKGLDYKKILTSLENRMQQKTQAIKDKATIAHQELTKTLKTKIKMQFQNISFIDRNKNIQDLEQVIEKQVFHALKITDNKCDFDSVKKVTRNIAEQMLAYRERFSKEPTDEQKLSFFLRARYELEREPEIKRKLSKMYKKEVQIGDDNMLLSERLARALSIDSRLADQSSIYYKPANFGEIKLTLKQGDKHILSMQAQMAIKGTDSKAKTEFIAQETVKYEERYGSHMPISQRNTLHEIGNYVSRGHKLLINNGFTHTEASRIMHREGAHLALYHNKRASQLQVSESTVKRIQHESRQLYTQSKIDIRDTSSTHHANHTRSGRSLNDDCSIGI